MGQFHMAKGLKRALAGIPLALVALVALALGFSFIFNATPETGPGRGSPEAREAVAGAEPPLRFFHIGDENRLAGPAEALRFPHLIDPTARLNFKSTLTLKRGNTLMNLLTSSGIARRQAFAAIEALSISMDPRKIRIGQTIEVTLEKGLFRKDEAPKLVGLRLPLEFGTELTVSFSQAGGYRSGLTRAPTTVLRMYAEGVIDDSLYLAALGQGVPLGVVSDMIRLFSFDVDFQREIWAGDRFAVYYERRLTADGEAENTGNILAASLILRGKPLTFYRYERADGKADFYTAEGKSARKMLMKTPIDGARLSSRYGNRKHPVLGYTRMHRGIDFGARTGTPVMAAGDGVIERSSRNGSYGNYIRIRHNSTYQTAYAHLSGYAGGIKSGARVKQGQIIGYVGATGRVTGAHLHYEILVNGQQINPLTLKMPKGDSLKTAELSVFSTQVSGFEAQKTAILAFYKRADAGITETTKVAGK